MRIANLARSGNTAEAIHLYREIFDTSQAESKSAIDDILTGKPVMLPGQKRLIPASASQTGLLLTIAKKYANDNPDEAIQLFMDAYGTDPNDSRNFVEQLVAGSLVELPDGTSFQIAQGFINMTRASSPPDMVKNRKSINLISIIAIAGILIGLIAAGVAVIFSLTQEKESEALCCPSGNAHARPLNRHPNTFCLTGPHFWRSGYWSGTVQRCTQYRIRFQREYLCQRHRNQSDPDL